MVLFIEQKLGKCMSNYRTTDTAFIIFETSRLSYVHLQQWIAIVIVKIVRYCWFSFVLVVYLLMRRLKFGIPPH